MAGRGVRIIAGAFRGLRLEVPRGLDVRPTADRVREALFSILGARVEGAAVLDCFSGTGALGIESLSRGAERVVFVESHRTALAALRKNLERLPEPVRARVLERDALSPADWPGDVLPVDIVFADPPYRKGLAMSVLDSLHPEDALSPGGLLVLEHEAEIEPEHPGWETLRRKTYGDTGLSFFGARQETRDS